MKTILNFLCDFFVMENHLKKNHKRRKKKRNRLKVVTFFIKNFLIHETDTQTNMLNTEHYHFLFSDTQTDTTTIFT